MGNKIIKSVSFNLTVKEESEMLKAIARKNFSGYVKKLIMNDLREAQAGKIQVDVKKIIEQTAIQGRTNAAPEEVNAAAKPKDGTQTLSAADRIAELRRQTNPSIGNARPFIPRRN